MVTPTAAQLQIRDHPGLDLVVVAPAGCGKTEALAFRIQGLLDRGSVVPPRKILVTTFSNRARDNIRDRLRDYLPVGSLRDRVSIANFHGLSARIFQAHAAAIGLDPRLTIPESDWTGDQCRRRKLRFDAAGEVQRILRVVKQQAVDDQEVERLLVVSGNVDAQEIERLRVAEGRLTYDDLPRLAELILQHDAVADLYRSHFAAVVVDEFQDLTPQQLRIVQRIGAKRTTYAGDLAQGIYGFAGARPLEIDAAIRAECGEVIEFAESHRSSPAVLDFLNTLASLTGGKELTSADPVSWPGGGVAGGMVHGTVGDEADWTVDFARKVLVKAPGQRIGVIARSASRRRFVDAALAASDLRWHRWDDGVLDTDTARVVKAMLSRLNVAELNAAPDPVEYLRMASGIDNVQDPSGREALADALAWCLDLLQQGVSVADVRGRIRIGDESTLITVAGVHLLTGHAGKGQQFDWVVVVGAEDGAIPDFRANTADELAEEARILAVMISRARHGVVIMNAESVPAASTGVPYGKNPSRFWKQLADSEPLGPAEIDKWLDAADWPAIAAR